MTIAWMRAEAQLWGRNWESEGLPTPITERVPLRVRFHGEGLVLDRHISLKVEQSANLVFMRFHFKADHYFDLEVPGVSTIHKGHTAEVHPS